MLYQRRSYQLTTYNIKPDDITSEDQLLRVLSSVKQAEDNVFNNKFKGIMEIISLIKGQIKNQQMFLI